MTLGGRDVRIAPVDVVDEGGRAEEDGQQEGGDRHRGVVEDGPDHGHHQVLIKRTPFR